MKKRRRRRVLGLFTVPHFAPGVVQTTGRGEVVHYGAMATVKIGTVQLMAVDNSRFASEAKAKARANELVNFIQAAALVEPGYATKVHHEKCKK